MTKYSRVLRCFTDGLSLLSCGQCVREPLDDEGAHMLGAHSERGAPKRIRVSKLRDESLGISMRLSLSFLLILQKPWPE